MLADHLAGALVIDADLRLLGPSVGKTASTATIGMSRVRRLHRRHDAVGVDGDDDDAVYFLLM
jgi:hypothetical protein